MSDQNEEVRRARELAHASWVEWNERLRDEFDARDAYARAQKAADEAFERAEQAQAATHVARKRARNALAAQEYRRAWEEPYAPAPPD